MKKLYTIYEDDDNRIIVAIIIENNVYYFQKGFASNEEAKEVWIEFQTQKEMAKHPNLSRSLAREFAIHELKFVTWGIW